MVIVFLVLMVIWFLSCFPQNPYGFVTNAVAFLCVLILGLKVFGNILAIH